MIAKPPRLLLPPQHQTGSGKRDNPWAPDWTPEVESGYTSPFQVRVASPLPPGAKRAHQTNISANNYKRGRRDTKIELALWVTCWFRLGTI